MTAPPWLDRFDRWFAEALETEPRVHDAMQIATVDADGAPHVRTVRLIGCWTSITRLLASQRYS